PVSFQYLYESISALCRFALSFFFNDPATTEIYTLSLHDALPIFAGRALDLRVHAVARLRRGLLPASAPVRNRVTHGLPLQDGERSEEHTSELQSRFDLVCRLLLEKKKKPYQVDVSDTYCPVHHLV